MHASSRKERLCRVINIHHRKIQVRMCRPQCVSECGLNQSIGQNCLRKARRVVKKYKKMSLKKEMNRLRQILPKGETLKQHAVFDLIISMTQQLEMNLLAKDKTGRNATKDSNDDGGEE